MATTISLVRSTQPSRLLDAAAAERASANNPPVMLSTSVYGGDLASQHVYAIEGITGTGRDATVTLRNPWGVDDGPAVIQARLGDLIGTNPLGGLGLGPTGMINIGRM